MKGIKRNRGEKRGFGLVELMVAVIIALSAAAGTTVVFLASEKNTSDSGRFIQAVNFSQDKLEELINKDLATGFNDPDLAAGLHTVSLPSQAELKEHFKGTLDYRINDIYEGPYLAYKKIEATAYWTAGGQTKSATLTTLLSNPIPVEPALLAAAEGPGGGGTGGTGGGGTGGGGTTSEFHLECVNEQCTSVSGTGADRCSTNEHCQKATHLECVNEKCTPVDGGGSDGCSSDIHCQNKTHLECVNEKCTSVAGTGSDACSSNIHCQKATHLECVNEKCTSVAGGGSNRCSSSLQCRERPEREVATQTIELVAMSGNPGDPNTQRAAGIMNGVVGAFILENNITGRGFTAAEQARLNNLLTNALNNAGLSGSSVFFVGAVNNNNYRNAASQPTATVASTVTCTGRSCTTQSTVLNPMNWTPRTPTTGTGTGGTLCLVAGTEVFTRKGLRPIENLAKGDLILTRNEASGKNEYKEVLKPFSGTRNKMVDMELVSGKIIQLSNNHPVYVVSKGWIEAERLEPGDNLVKNNGKVEQVKTMKPWPLDRYTEVYNCEVEGNHNFFVSEEGIMVHNGIKPAGTTDTGGSGSTGGGDTGAGGGGGTGRTQQLMEAM